MVNKTTIKNHLQLKTGDLLNDTYKVVGELGRGGHGTVFKISHLHNPNSTLALKAGVQGSNSLLHEYHVMRNLSRLGVPDVHDLWRLGKHDVMTMDYMGQSLSMQAKAAGGAFPLLVVVNLMAQMLGLIQSVHNAGYIHRDVKPHNFLMKDKELYLIDFGLAAKYKEETGSHVPFKEGLKPLGSWSYMSIPCLKGHKLGRRDDLESLAYTSARLLMGKLPWPNKKSNETLEIKEKTKPHDIFKGFPKEFPDFLEYSQSLEYDEKPAYDFW